MPKRRFPSALPLQTRAVAVGPVDVERRTATMTFSAGAAVRRREYAGWDFTPTEFDEILIVSRDAVNLDHMNGGAPVLDTHYRYSVLGQLGVVERAWIEGRGKAAEARCEVRFYPEGQSELADQVFAGVAGGIIRNVSVGYTLDDVRVVPANEKKGTVEQRFVERWTPYEVSFVTLGADPKAQVRGNAESVTYPVAFHEDQGIDSTREEHNTMNREQQITELCTRYGVPEKAAEYIAGALAPEAVETELKARAAPPAPPVPVRPAAAGNEEALRLAQEASQRAVAEERTRIALINQAVSDFGMDAADGQAAVSGGQSIDQVRAAFQAKLAERNRGRAPATRPVTEGVRGGMEERETRVRLASSALAHRLRASTALETGAEIYRHRSLFDLACDFLEAEGVKTRSLSKQEIARLATVPGGNFLSERAGLHTTSDFPIILGNTVNRVLRAAYDAAPTTYQRIARRSTATDFRPLIRAQIGDAPRLLKVNEHGEFRYGSVGEGSESYKLLTYGRIFGITRQAIINDDLGAFDRVPATWGRSAAMLQNEIVWALITGEVQMADGNALFSAAHGNLAADHEAVNPVSIAAARHAIRTQRGVAPTAGSASDGERAGLIGQEGTILAAPSARELEVLQFLAPIVVPTTDGAVNPFKSLLSPLIEPLLDEANPLTWYIFVDGNSPTAPIEYSFLDGQEGVYTENRVGFEVDGVEFKARLDFGAGVLDYHGAYRNPGEEAS